MYRVAINGFGRIGRLIFRAYAENYRDVQEKIHVVCINGSDSGEVSHNLVKYDSIHGALSASVSLNHNKLVCNGKSSVLEDIRETNHNLWVDHSVQCVFECTGSIAKNKTVRSHIRNGASIVIVASPTDEADKTIVYGVNHQTITKSDLIISNSSCTTNALAPIVHILDAAVGIEMLHTTTTHAYTNDQSLLDSRHTDLYRARACAMSIIPTSSGAQKAIGIIFPHLKKCISVSSTRVPIPNTSMLECIFTTKKKSTTEEINSIISQYRQSSLKEIVDCSYEKKVSIDFNHTPYSVSIDLNQTRISSDGLSMNRLVGWYDNEWAYALRMIDVMLYTMQKRL